MLVSFQNILYTALFCIVLRTFFYNILYRGQLRRAEVSSWMSPLADGRNFDVSEDHIASTVRIEE
jgi:hypothetical protein